MKLRPCPFCSKKVVIFTEWIDGVGEEMSQVWCERCNKGRDHFLDIDDAIVDWNRHAFHEANPGKEYPEPHLLRAPEVSLN